MGTYQEVAGKIFHTINIVDASVVNDIAASMVNAGWVGAPVLVLDGEFAVTGSHRLAACALAEIEPVTQELTDLLTDSEKEDLQDWLTPYSETSTIAHMAARWVELERPDLAEEYDVQC